MGYTCCNTSVKNLQPLSQKSLLNRWFRENTDIKQRLKPSTAWRGDEADGIVIGISLTDDVSTLMKIECRICSVDVDVIDFTPALF